MTEATILLCEDDMHLRQIYAKHLTKSDYNVILAENGSEGLTLIEQNDVDLVLTDLMMPLMDGMELCRRVKGCERFSAVPVLILTANETVEAEIAGLDCGADDYIAKPVQPAVLLARVRRALKRAEEAKVDKNAAARDFAGLELLRIIGAGTFGEVHLAHDPGLERDVAIKIVREQFADDPEARERFLREGKAMCAVRHPGVVSVHSVGEHGGKPYIVMEYLTGGNLGTRREDAMGIPVKQMLRIAIQVADALGHLHKAGIIHRDIKPENILFDADDRPVLVDFGIALMSAASRLTMDGTVMGTLSYMAPEHFNDWPIDGRTDLYALGAVIYETMSGVVPIKANTVERTMAKILTEDPVHLKDLDLGLKPEVADTVMRFLAKKPDTRYQTAEEAVAALEAVTA